jgi:alpha-galactosidase
MNRHLNDLWSPSLPADRQGEFAHRWVLGLYDLVRRVTAAFPEVLFENCASGGHRNDWGMFAYFHQAWMSDNTDAGERPVIHQGASYFLPPSVWGAHVSAGTNHQVLRRTSLEARFDAAAFGLLGYELDLGTLTPAERQILDRQVLWYKDLRQCLQFGTFHRLGEPGADKATAFLSVAPDGTRAVAGWFGGLARANALPGTLVLTGLEPDAVYRVEARPASTDIRPFGDLIKGALPVPLKVNGWVYTLVADRYLMPLEAPSFRARGDLLMSAGLPLTRPFHGTGAAPGILLAGDWATQLFVLTKEGTP